ncbi:hypothetical protein ACQPW3_31070 [Actinosynnema sp. CA-248983]
MGDKVERVENEVNGPATNVVQAGVVNGPVTINVTGAEAKAAFQADTGIFGAPPLDLGGTPLGNPAGGAFGQPHHGSHHDAAGGLFST